jgi:hypothetical protein
LLGTISMNITELLTEKRLEELGVPPKAKPGFNVGRALGTGVRGVAKSIGAVAGAGVGAIDATKQGYRAGKSWVAGQSSGGSTTPAVAGGAPGGSTTPAVAGGAPGGSTTPAVAGGAPAVSKPSTPVPKPSPSSVGKVIDFPGSDMKFKYSTNWVDPKGNPASQEVMNVLNQISSGVSPDKIPTRDLLIARRSLGLSEVKKNKKKKVVEYYGKFLNQDIQQKFTKPTGAGSTVTGAGATPGATTLSANPQAGAAVKPPIGATATVGAGTTQTPPAATDDIAQVIKSYNAMNPVDRMAFKKQMAGKMTGIAPPGTLEGKFHSKFLGQAI